MPREYYQANNFDELNQVLTDVSHRLGQIRPDGSIIYNVIGGWTVSDQIIYVTDRRGSTSNPESGIFLDADDTCIYIYEGNRLRISLGNLAPRETTISYGLRGYDASGAVIFELSNTQKMIGGWTLTTATLTNSSVTLHSTGAVYVKSSTFGEAGAQLEYNDGTPRFYVGDGSSQYLKFDGTDVLIGGGIAATSGTIGGWAIGAQTLSNSSVTLHSTGALYIKSSTFGDLGCQIKYNNGNPVFYVGDGVSDFLQYTSTYGVEVGVGAGGSFALQEGAYFNLHGLIVRGYASSAMSTTTKWTLGATGTHGRFFLAAATANGGAGYYYNGGWDPDNSLYYFQIDGGGNWSSEDTAGKWCVYTSGGYLKFQNRFIAGAQIICFVWSGGEAL